VVHSCHRKTGFFKKPDGLPLVAGSFLIIENLNQPNPAHRKIDGAKRASAGVAVLLTEAIETGQAARQPD
jgi:hypothetical protein